MFKKYYENTRTYQCVECKYAWTQSFWQWLFTIMHFDITRHRYVKCPRGSAKQWLQAVKVE